MLETLPPRERQLFETLYAMKEATAAQLEAAMDQAPSNSAVRVMLRRLERKGFVKHREDGGRYIYAPALTESRIRQSALTRFVETYFGGSAVGAATALLGISHGLKESDLDLLESLVSKARAARDKR